MIESQIEVGGGVVFWALAEWTDRDVLHAGLAALGRERFLPPARPPASALREALEDALGGPRVLVRPLAKRDGFAVVREDRDDAGSTYSQELVGRVTTPAGRSSCTCSRWTSDSTRCSRRSSGNSGWCTGRSCRPPWWRWWRSWA